MSGATEVLDKLLTNHTVTVGEGEEAKTVTIRKVTLRTMKAVIDLISAVLADLKLAPDPAGDMMLGVDIQSPSVILKLISDHLDAAVDAIQPLTSLTKDELLDMDSDSTIVVVQAVIRLNQDFFTTKVLPRLKTLGGAPASAPKADDSEG